MNANEIVMWLRQNNRKSGWTDIDRMMDKSANLIESLQAQLAASQHRADAAVKELTRQLKVPDDDICARCRNQIECRQTECEQYESGIGATSVDGTEYPNFKWSCMDFDHGTCNKMQNTSCSGCFDNEYSGFEWRGSQDEKGEAE